MSVTPNLCCDEIKTEELATPAVSRFHGICRLFLSTGPRTSEWVELICHPLENRTLASVFQSHSL